MKLQEVESGIPNLMDGLCERAWPETLTIIVLGSTGAPSSQRSNFFNRDVSFAKCITVVVPE
jgi:hypothetical protein